MTEEDELVYRTSKASTRIHAVMLNGIPGVPKMIVDRLEVVWDDNYSISKLKQLIQYMQQFPLEVLYIRGLGPLMEVSPEFLQVVISQVRDHLKVFRMECYGRLTSIPLWRHLIDALKESKVRRLEFAFGSIMQGREFEPFITDMIAATPKLNSLQLSGGVISNWNYQKLRDILQKKDLKQLTISLLSPDNTHILIPTLTQLEMLYVDFTWPTLYPSHPPIEAMTECLKLPKLQYIEFGQPTFGDDDFELDNGYPEELWKAFIECFSSAYYTRHLRKAVLDIGLRTDTPGIRAQLSLLHRHLLNHPALEKMYLFSDTIVVDDANMEMEEELDGILARNLSERTECMHVVALAHKRASTQFARLPIEILRYISRFLRPTYDPKRHIQRKPKDSIFRLPYSEIHRKNAPGIGLSIQSLLT